MVNNTYVDLLFLPLVCVHVHGFFGGAGGQPEDRMIFFF